MDRKNLASRAAHWSATHRKTAIWGWLVFIVVAFMVGNAVGQKELHGADDFNGESGRAERTLYDAGLRPNHENVLPTSCSLQASLRTARSRSSAPPHVIAHAGFLLIAYR